MTWLLGQFKWYRRMRGGVWCRHAYDRDSMWSRYSEPPFDFSALCGDEDWR